MDFCWICVVSNGSLGRSSFASFEVDMRNVFGNDLEQVRLVEGNGSDDEDSYVLIKCRNYYDHSETLRFSKRVHK